MSDTLIAHFSTTGTTAHVAKKLTKVTDRYLHEIEPKTPYAQKNLNWMNPFSRSTREMKGRLPYPEIKKKDIELGKYFRILLEFSIW